MGPAAGAGHRPGQPPRSVPVMGGLPPDGVRISGGAEVIGPGLLGAGSQVLGPISARSVDLAAGRPHTYPDPDHRGAVLKGFGRAQGICLGTGEVLNGAGDFAAVPLQRQRHYHPDAPHLPGL